MPSDGTIIACPGCDGTGTVTYKQDGAMWWQRRTARCGVCGGTGLVQHPQPITKGESK